MDFALTTLAAAFATVFVGALLQGMIGFGLGLVAVPVLVQLDSALVPGPVLLAMLALSFGIGWRERQSVNRRALIIPVGGQGLGILLALAILGWIDPRTLSILIGFVVGVAVLLSWVGLSFSPAPTPLFLAGMLAGFMGTTASIPGPPLALLYQNSAPAQLRGTMAHFLVVGNLASLFGLVWVGRLGLSEVGAGLLLIPAVVLGYFASGRLVDGVDARMIRVAVLAFSLLAAASLIYRSI